MSCNRENVTWQAEDGTWSIGFFAFYAVNQDSPDWDFEWDVEYDHSRFNWTSHGHATEDDALDAWDGANPGGTTYVPRADFPEECRRYDEMAAAHLREELEQVDEALAHARGGVWGRHELAQRRRELKAGLDRLKVPS